VIGSILHWKGEREQRSPDGKTYYLGSGAPAATPVLPGPAPSSRRPRGQAAPCACAVVARVRCSRAEPHLVNGAGCFVGDAS